MSAALAMILALGASALAGICAYADGALLSVDADQPLIDLHIADLVKRRDRAHRALAFARVALQVAAGAGCGLAVAQGEGLAKIPLVALVIAGVMLVVLSETAARDAGDRHGISALAKTRGFIELVERGLVVVVLAGEGLDRMLRRLVTPAGIVLDDEQESVDRFRQVVTAQAGVGDKGTSILTGVFALGDTTVADVMTPRVDIVSVDRDDNWDEVVARFRNSEHARLLVQAGNPDAVLGVLYAKDVLPYITENREPEHGWMPLVRPVLFIPATKPVDRQLREFRALQRHIAVIADEYGGTAGIVTIEDLLELIVGEIRDEHDVEEPEIEAVDASRYHVAGRLTLEQLSEKIGDDLTHDDVTTVGGLAYELFGRVPRSGEMADYRSWRFRIDRVKGRRIERVFLERAPAAVGADEGESP